MITEHKAPCYVVFSTPMLTSFLLGPNILLSTPSKTFSLRSFLNIGDQFSRPSKTMLPALYGLKCDVVRTILNCVTCVTFTRVWRKAEDQQIRKRFQTKSLRKLYLAVGGTGTGRFTMWRYAVWTSCVASGYSL